MMELIEQQPQAQKSIEDGFVNLCYEIETVQMDTPTYEGQDSFQNANKAVIAGKIGVAMKRLPGFKKTASEIKTTSVHQRMNEEWVLDVMGQCPMHRSEFVCQDSSENE